MQETMSQLLFFLSLYEETDKKNINKNVEKIEKILKNTSLENLDEIRKNNKGDAG